MQLQRNTARHAIIHKLLRPHEAKLCDLENDNNIPTCRNKGGRDTPLSNVTIAQSVMPCMISGFREAPIIKHCGNAKVRMRTSTCFHHENNLPWTYHESFCGRKWRKWKELQVRGTIYKNTTTFMRVFCGRNKRRMKRTSSKGPSRLIRGHY